MFDGVSVNSRFAISVRFLLILLLIIFLLPILGFTFHSPYLHNHIVGLWSAEENVQPRNATVTGPLPNHQASANTTLTTPPSSQSEQARQPHNSSLIKNSTEISPTNGKPINGTVAPTDSSNFTNSSCNMPQPPFYPLQPPEEQDIPQVLRDYIAFHKEGRACLLNPECKQKPKILVANCPRNMGCLGIGDRMRGLVFSFTIAIITKRVYFLHEITPSYPLKAGVAPFAIDWTLPPTVQFNHSWPYLGWYWCRGGRPCENNMPASTNFPNFENEGPDINLWTDDIVKLFDDKPIVSLASRITAARIRFLLLNPYLNETYAELATIVREKTVNLYRLLFQPSEATRKMLKTLEFKNDYISVHIRTGVDSGESAKERFRYLAGHEEESVGDVIECLRRVDEGKNVTNVFLASDSPKTKALFLRKSKEKGLNVHLVAKKTVHFERTWKFESLTWDSLCDGFITVFADLFMLARGRIMVKTGSNFADFAHKLAKDQHVVIFKPGVDSLEESCKPLR